MPNQDTCSGHECFYKRTGVKCIVCKAATRQPELVEGTHQNNLINLIIKSKKKMAKFKFLKYEDKKTREILLQKNVTGYSKKEVNKVAQDFDKIYSLENHWSSIVETPFLFPDIQKAPAS